MTDTYSTPDSWTYEPPAKPKRKNVELCTCCQREPTSRKSKTLCKRCHRYARDHDGELPPQSVLSERARLDYARLTDAYQTGARHRRRIARRLQVESYDDLYDLPSLPMYEPSVDLTDQLIDGEL